MRFIPAVSVYIALLHKYYILFRVVVQHLKESRLTPLISAAGGIIEDTAYADSVTVTFRIHEASYDKLSYDIVDKSNGRFQSEVIDEKFSQI